MTATDHKLNKAVINTLSKLSTKGIDINKYIVGEDIKIEKIAEDATDLGLTSFNLDAFATE
ncbi:hypothetical protein [Priestia flexa]|uniref:hypothetical protein n=1 Tax=Priestia flexa TaxID=86664 RepID=UPI003CFD7428